MLLINLIPVNTAKNFITIHLQLSQTNLLEVVILLMTYLKKYVSNKREDLNLSVFNMIKGKNESKTLTKHVSVECECKFDRVKFNSNP